jgi:hypothetical protein
MVHTLDGYGRPQWLGTMGSQSCSRSGGALGVGVCAPPPELFEDEWQAAARAMGTTKARRTRVSMWARCT